MKVAEDIDKAKEEQKVSSIAPEEVKKPSILVQRESNPNDANRYC